MYPASCMSKYFSVLLHISHVFSLGTCFEDFKLSCRHRAGNILKVVSNYCKHSLYISLDQLVPPMMISKEKSRNWTFKSKKMIKCTTRSSYNCCEFAQFNPHSRQLFPSVCSRRLTPTSAENKKCCRKTPELAARSRWK